MNHSARRDVQANIAGRRIASCLVGLLMLSMAVSFAVGYDNWLQTSKDSEHSGYTPGITMYPINEYPRPTGGLFPTYAWIADLDEPHRGGNVETHIAAWYEGTQTEANLRVAFTTTNRDNVGAIYCVDADGDNIDGFPIMFEDGNYDSEGDAESSIAVYYDGVDQEYDTRLVVALNSMDDGVGTENQVRAYDLSGDLVWWSNTDDWVSRHCSPVIWIDPDWGDYDEDGDDDDFVYVFEYDYDDTGETPGKTRVQAIDLTKDEGGNGITPTYYSSWFEDLTPTYSTPVICEVPQEGYEGSDTYMLFFLDEWEYSENIEQFIKTGTRAIAIDINPENLVSGVYDTVFNVGFEQYDTMVIPGPGGDEYIDLHLTVDMDPAAAHMLEDHAGENNDWWGFVFGVADGSDGTGPDLIFLDKEGTVSAEHDLTYPATKYGAAQPTMTDPLVVGSPAVKDADSPYMEEIYVLYSDRETGRIGTAYFRDVVVIDTNQIYLAPTFLPNDEYKPLSPVITDEFLYVGCDHNPYEAPYRDNGGMVYINLQTIRANTTMGFFHTLPFSLYEGYAQFYWNATPALIKLSASDQYLYMGVSDINLYGGKLWRLST